MDMRKNFQLDLSGFTLLELLVSMAVFSIIGTIATISLSLLFRGAVKTDFVKDIKQNGDYALTLMEVNIRNQTILDANCTGTPATSLTITGTGIGSADTIYSCVHDVTSNKNRLMAQTGVTTNFLTNTTVTVPPLPSDCDLTNVSFTCTVGTGGNKIVDIYLKLQQANLNVSEAEKTSQVFTTRINLRNP